MIGITRGLSQPTRQDYVCTYAKPFTAPHVLGAFKGTRIGAAYLAHAALHVTDRFVFVILHPLAPAAFYMTQMVKSIAKQGGTQHGYIGTHQEHFNYVFGTVNSAGGG